MFSKSCVERETFSQSKLLLMPFREFALTVFKVVEISRVACPRKVLAAHPDKRPGEIRQARRPCFVGQNARIEHFRQPLPFLAARAKRKPQALVIDFYPQMHGHAPGDRNRRGERVRQLWVACHYSKMLADCFIRRTVQVMEFEAVVVADQPGLLLVVLGFELDRCRGAVTVGLLPSGNQRLAEQAASSLAPEQPQVPGPRGQAE